MSLLEQIKDLRARTGAGVADCKKYLLQAHEDVDEALRLLHVAGFKPKAGRIAAEGAVFSCVYHQDGHPVAGALVEVNCETDFVANTQAFRTFGQSCAERMAYLEYHTPTDLTVQGLVQDLDIAAHLKTLIDTTRENIVVRRATFFAVGGA